MAGKGKSPRNEGDENSQPRPQRSDEFTEAKRAVFLDVLEKTSGVTTAARAAGVSRKTAYEHRNKDPEFAARWDEAEDSYADRLVREAYRRAVDGVDEPVYQQGELVGVIRRYSDSLLNSKLKAHRPEKYRERVTAEVTTTAKVVMVVPSVASSEAEWSGDSTLPKDDKK